MGSCTRSTGIGTNGSTTGGSCASTPVASKNIATMNTPIGLHESRRHLCDLESNIHLDWVDSIRRIHLQNKVTNAV